MRLYLFCLLLLPLLVSSRHSPVSVDDMGRKLLTCNEKTATHNSACKGYYCYKIYDELKSITKKGCLNVTDTYSSIGECKEKGDTIGHETYRSYMCICNDRNRCNSASHDQQSTSFILLTVLSSLLFYINAAGLIGS